MSGKRIIIVGGGFGGVKCAKVLTRELSPGEAEIVLFNRENHMVFSPLLPEAVGSSINPLDAVVPLRQLLPQVYCRTEEVKGIDLDRSEIEYETDECRRCRMSYDQLVLACGSTANLHAVPGMADYAFPLKNIADAIVLRSHIMEEMEKAEVCSDPELRCWHLTFIVVGGGFTGVEVAGEINELVRSSMRYFKNFRARDITVTLIHSRGQILPEVSSDLREFARKQMEKAGVNFLLDAYVTSASPEGIALRDGQCVKGGTVVCTIGTSPPALVEDLPVPKQKGWLVAEADLRLPGSPNVWVVGDCAVIINQHDGRPAPSTGQFAEREGARCADNIVRVLRSRPTRPFSYKPRGQLCSLGGRSAVGEVFGFHLAGFAAWFVWRGVYLFKLPSWARRFQVGLDWALLLLFPRDLSHLRNRQTDRATHSRYQPGDFVFKMGEPRMDFYVVEMGEVEVMRCTERHPEGEAVSVLGPGSLFGERSMLNHAPRLTSVRARTPVKLVVLGTNVFTQCSPSLACLRDALAQTLNSRADA
jgi:NADH:ubiquinone reductase (H+-translocating)